MVDELHGPATVRLTMPVGTFARLAGGRTTPDRVDVTITGDTAVGNRVLAAMNFTI